MWPIDLRDSLSTEIRWSRETDPNAGEDNRKSEWKSFDSPRGKSGGASGSGIRADLGGVVAAPSRHSCHPRKQEREKMMLSVRTHMSARPQVQTLKQFVDAVGREKWSRRGKGRVGRERDFGPSRVCHFFFLFLFSSFPFKLQICVWIQVQIQIPIHSYFELQIS